MKNKFHDIDQKISKIDLPFNISGHFLETKDFDPALSFGEKLNWMYDKAGNRLSDQQASAGNTVRRQSYNISAGDQITNSVSGGPLHVSGQLNKPGRIDGMTVNRDSLFIWDGLKITEERLSSSPSLSHIFYFDEGYDYGYHNGKMRFYMKDHLGSVRTIFKNDSWEEWDPTLVSQIAYDPYGNPEFLNGNESEGDMLYTGHFYHRPSGLYLAPYRAYDPKIGRWLSREPLGLDGPNLYHYGFNDPVNTIDPDGLLVTGTFDRANNELHLTDDDKGDSVKVFAFSGGNNAGCGPVNYRTKPNENPIPAGEYIITENPSPKPGREHWYGIIPIDSWLDDKTDSGRGEFRLHPGGLSYGCITICGCPNRNGAKNWKDVDDLLKDTNKGKIPFYRGRAIKKPNTWLNPVDKNWTKYGVITVK